MSRPDGARAKRPEIAVNRRQRQVRVLVVEVPHRRDRLAKIRQLFLPRAIGRPLAQMVAQVPEGDRVSQGVGIDLFEDLLGGVGLVAPLSRAMISAPRSTAGRSFSGSLFIESITTSKPASRRARGIRARRIDRSGKPGPINAVPSSLFEQVSLEANRGVKPSPSARDRRRRACTSARTAVFSAFAGLRGVLPAPISAPARSRDRRGTPATRRDRPAD